MTQPTATKRQQTKSEEVANAITHGLGAALSVVGLVVLVLRASETGDPWRIVSFSVFGATMVLLYVGSTLYHSLAHTRARKIFKILDHSLIYLLIAGTYTPFLLVYLRGPWGWSLIGVLWGLALAGAVFKALFADRFSGVSTALYLGMGWAGAIAVKPLLQEVPMSALQWLLAGGVAYSVGTAVYVRRSLKYHHAIWHLFVLAGTGCHFIAVYSHLS